MPRPPCRYFHRRLLSRRPPSALSLTRALPKTITTDTGPEFTGKAVHLWAQSAHVHLHHIQPGNPLQNAFIESFDGTFRNGCLNRHWFSSLAEARLLIEHLRNEHNQLRPHSSIGHIPPDAFALIFKNHKPITHPRNPVLA